MVLASAKDPTSERITDLAAAPSTRSGASLNRRWQAIAALAHDRRAPDRIQVHYELEKRLAARLMGASSSERSRVYGEVYDELFSSLPDHPQNTRKHVPIDATVWQLSLLRRLVPAGARFAEIGAGDALVSLGLCDHCAETVAIDVSEGVLGDGPKPANFSFVTIDGIHMPFENERFDFVYSNQLMEHLHPDDALAQLREILRVLKPGGAYLCITPNRLTGPHDVSKYFDSTPTGFHLKEYTYSELSRLFIDTGFSRTAVVFKKGRWYFQMPSWVGTLLERVIARVYPAQRRPVTHRSVRNVMGVNLLGVKR